MQGHVPYPHSNSALNSRVLFRIDPVSDAPLFELRESVVTRRPPAREKGVALTFDEDAGVAQLAEHLLCKQGVAGSIPVAGSAFRI